MPDYSKGKIYKIYNSINEKCYIGSTVNSLNRRLSAHKCQYKTNRWKNVTAYELFDEDFENIKISLIEKFPCRNKTELFWRERYWMEQMDCLNKQKPILTKQEAVERDKLYYEINKDKILEQQKKYYEINKDKVKEQTKKYREINKDKMKEQKKKYYEINKHKMLEKVTCECGSVITKKSLIRHKKTKKHLNFLISK